MAKSPEDAIVDTRRIAAALRVVGDYVTNREGALIAEIISHYRSGRTEHDFVVGRMAELSAGRHLLTEMQRSMTQESKDG